MIEYLAILIGIWFSFKFIGEVIYIFTPSGTSTNEKWYVVEDYFDGGYLKVHDVDELYSQLLNDYGREEAIATMEDLYGRVR